MNIFKKTALFATLIFTLTSCFNDHTDGSTFVNPQLKSHTIGLDAYYASAEPVISGYDGQGAPDNNGFSIHWSLENEEGPNSTVKNHSVNIYVKYDPLIGINATIYSENSLVYVDKIFGGEDHTDHHSYNSDEIIVTNVEDLKRVLHDLGVDLNTVSLDEFLSRLGNDDIQPSFQRVPGAFT